MESGVVSSSGAGFDSGGPGAFFRRCRL